MSQAVFAYVAYVSDVLLICWCGTQLTEHVRESALLCLLLTLLTHYCHNGYRASNQFINYGPI
jgi:hypothetical protein